MARGESNGAVRWLQLPILIPPVLLLVSGAMGLGVVQAQVENNEKAIAEAREEDEKLRARVRGTEINQAVVKSNTDRIRMDVQDLGEDLDDLDAKLNEILRRLPPQ